MALQPGHHLDLAEHLRDVADAAMGVEFVAIPADHAAGFLPAMLQGVQPQRGGCGSFGGADHPENSALLAQVVGISIPRGGIGGFEGALHGRGLWA